MKSAHKGQERRVGSAEDEEGVRFGEERGERG